MLLHICFRAQKPSLLTSAEYETKTIVQFFSLQLFHNSKQTCAATHVVISAVG